jgi:hypothetical protein
MTGDAKDAAQRTVEPDEGGDAELSNEQAARDGFPMLRLQRGIEPRADACYRVEELLVYHDRAFVESAYAAALGRAPGAAELEATLADLRSSRRDKREIVEDLIRSDEGARVGAGARVRLNQTPGWKRRVRRLPLVGYLWQLFGAIARLPTALRHQQEFESYALAQQQLIADHINAQQRQTADQLKDQRRVLVALTDDLRLSLTDANEAISMLSDALATLSARQAEARVEFDRRQDEQTRQLAARLDEQTRRLDGQEEYLIQEQRVIVEAQKAALAEIEARLGESLAAQAHTLEELSRQLRAAVEASRQAKAAEEV